MTTYQIQRKHINDRERNSRWVESVYSSPLPSEGSRYDKCLQKFRAAQLNNKPHIPNSQQYRYRVVEVTTSVSIRPV
jgi:hypothetical protein